MFKIIKKTYRLSILLWFKILRKINLRLEHLKYSRIIPEKNCLFWIVSCERNAGAAAIRCLESVYSQKYNRELIRHLFIDDASNDGTDELVRKWLIENPDHRVDFLSQNERMGGTFNTVMGFRKAPSHSIVIELNGDDWLPDDFVFDFLNRVYANPEVWMTYNTFQYSDGSPRRGSHPYPRHIVKHRHFREYKNWLGQPLHSFRRELFSNLKEETFIDPQTGKYWESADDQAIYLSMFEMAGGHAKHLYRITYVYNMHDNSSEVLDRDGSAKRAARIRGMAKYPPLSRL